ncbi:nitrilase-related carbon-nitrogen hydrolase [Embleya scabrispora]|uniref:nitrilase-related carbon-nitrogen hydrolase n=1 Tax=Embleya scabrispora TaxID=159449 RepID=UPI00037FC1B6|nr:nitrilase-related carbon-nitrogen hydrolase [Embleya scabrispora]MYS85114.1 nitrilase [Streptomyces sp. SID5474]
MPERIEKYTALVVQPEVSVAKNEEGIRANLERITQLIDFGVGYFWEVPVRLVVLPEYFMQGVTTPGKGEDGIQQFLDKAVSIPGPEMDVLAEKAREYGIYIAGGGVIEVTPEFPDRWFNTAFIIDPSGEIALKYHKWHIPATLGLGSSPHDLYDDYGKVYGNSIKDLFPVLDTEIGKLGTMTCHDGCTPEVSRALGFNGVEVICHPGAIQEFEGVSRPWDFWKFTRQTRAHDNMSYLLGSNWGQVNHAFYPKAFCPGGSMIIDYTGMVLREAPYPSEQIIAATIDIESLREHRTIANHNTWIDVRTEPFREIYADPIYPANRFPDGQPPRNLAAKVRGARDAMRTLYARGQFTPPDGFIAEEMADLLESRVLRAQNRGLLRKD